MLKRYSLLVLYFLLFHFGWGQSYEVGEKFDSENDVTAISCSKSFWINSYLADKAGFMKVYGYEVVERSGFTHRFSGPIDRKFEDWKGVPLTFFEKNGVIYELVVFVKSGLRNKCRIGLIKRTVQNFHQEGEIAWVGEYGFEGTSYPDLAMYSDSTGITILGGRLHGYVAKPFIARYDFDLSLKWKKEPEIFAEEKTFISDYSIDEEGRGLIILRTGNSYPKIGGVITNPTTISFVIVDEDGTLTHVTPSFGKTDMVFTKGDFYFDFDRRIIVGIGLIARMKNEFLFQPDNFGYAYFKCGLDGNPIVLKQHFFTYGDIYTPDAKAQLNKLHDAQSIEDEKFFPRVKFPEFKAIRDEKDGFIVVFSRLLTEKNGKSDIQPPLPFSSFFFAVDESGEISWKNLWLSTTPNPTAIFSDGENWVRASYFLKENDQLTWFCYVPESQFFDNLYQVDSGDLDHVSNSNIALMITFSCVDGTMKYKKLSPQVESGMSFDAYFGTTLWNGTFDQTLFLRFENVAYQKAQFVVLIPE